MILQFFMALFGLCALAIALSDKDYLYKWAAVVGLCGQPFWIWFAFQKEAWGLLVISLAYSGVYIRSIWRYWGKIKEIGL